MALDDDIHILSTIELFGAFSAEQLRLLAFGAERLVLRPGRELFSEGQSADCAYIVVSGSIVLYKEVEQNRVPIRTVGPGTILGEMALIARTSRLTAASTETETEVIRINRSIFHRILEEYPEAAVSLHDYVSRSLTTLIADIEAVAPRLTNGK